MIFETDSPDEIIDELIRENRARLAASISDYDRRIRGMSDGEFSELIKERLANNWTNGSDVRCLMEKLEARDGQIAALKTDLDGARSELFRSDRIVANDVIQITKLHADLSELKSIRGDFLEFVKKVSRATVTVPWEAGYGPGYMPTAGDPERSVSDLIATVRQQTARECADIAEIYKTNSGIAISADIREKYGVTQ